MGRLLFGRLRESALEALTSARESGHNRADRRAGNGSDLLVGAAFEFAQNDDFAETHRKSFKSAREPIAVVTRDGKSFRVCDRLLVQVLVEFGHELHLAVFLQPRITRVANDLQKPCPGVPTVETPEKTKRPQQSFLRDVLRIVAASQQPTRKIESGVKMR